MRLLSRSIPPVAIAILLVAPEMLAQRAMPDTFAPVVKKSQPAVVNISTTVVRKVRGYDFFDYFYGPGRRPQREQRGHSLGSGVIVRPDGYLLTNNHVVEGATDIKVSLSDRREFKARLVGADPASDVALLKIDASGLLALPFGDSSKAEVGDIVLALGNPFGIGQTVTMGIIGATGRTGLGIEQYEDFIQTDAAINPGNSGGALVNAQGELIGINTAILSGGEGNQGVGFAVPINMARNVMDQILKSGKVVRGYIGAGGQDVTSEIAQGLGLKQSYGVVLTQIEPDSPAAKAGLKPGDVVTEINGAAVNSFAEMRLRVSSIAPGTLVKLRVAGEDGAAKEVPVTLAQLPSPKTEDQEQSQPAQPGSRGGAMDGVAVIDLTARVGRQLGAPADLKGVVVREVATWSAAAEAGLRPGDVIQRINRQPVASVDDYERLLRQAGDKPVVLLLNRRGQTAYVVVEPGK
jgi:serine protease Do